MLTRIDLRDTDPDARDLAAILPRADLDVAAALEAVAAHATALWVCLER